MSNQTIIITGESGTSKTAAIRDWQARNNHGSSVIEHCAYRVTTCPHDCDVMDPGKNCPAPDPKPCFDRTREERKRIMAERNAAKPA